MEMTHGLWSLGHGSCLTVQDASPSFLSGWNQREAWEKSSVGAWTILSFWYFSQLFIRGVSAAPVGEWWANARNFFLHIKIKC